jgi:hypothetical protein
MTSRRSSVTSTISRWTHRIDGRWRGLVKTAAKFRQLLTLGRDLAVAIAAVAILGSLLGSISRREARQIPNVYYGAAISPQTSGAVNRAAGLPLKVGGAALYAAERRP